MKIHNNNNKNEKSRILNRHPAALYAVLALLVMLTTAAAVNMIPEGPDENYSSAVIDGGGNTEPTILVTNSFDCGDGSLRQMIADAKDGDIIGFADDVTTITLMSEIEFGQSNITIDGRGVVTIDANKKGRALNSTASTGTLTLKGLTIKNGTVTGSADGGGVYVSKDTVLIDCAFENNTAGNGGGGLYADTITTMTGCTFTDNRAGRWGGGLYAVSIQEMTGCTFTLNTAGFWGGGAYAGSVQTTTDCTFTLNTAVFMGGGMIMYSEGGYLTGCTFTLNTAGSGGALYSYGHYYNLYIINSTISGNTTTNSSNGAVCSEEVTYLIHTTVTDNKGGGIYSDYDPVYLYNCIVSGNTNIWNPL
ncbi:MAG: hypothetical protein LBH88_02850, partial [Candidatus Methanoplasma sp.]|nr:hypothetical protein [Candidatus Methanoplasma sp.]